MGDEEITLADLTPPRVVKVSIQEGKAAWDLRQPWWYKDGFGRMPPPSFAAVVSVDDKPVAVARMFLPIQLSQPGLTWKACGIGGVFTVLEERNRGYASMAVRFAMDHARDIGCGCAALYARENLQRLYIKLGFAKAIERIGGEWLYIAPLYRGLIVDVGKWKIHPEEHF